MAKKAYDSERDDYKTPPWVFNQLLQIAGVEQFDMDVCCSEPNIPAKYHCLSFIDDGLITVWNGKKLFMNPPFRPCPKWVAKAISEFLADRTREIFMVLPADRFETKYYQEHFLYNPDCLFAFLPGKVGFIIPGEEDAEPIPSQKIMIAIFTRRALDLQYSWNYYNWFNTASFVGVKRGRRE